jgi:serine/threonine protein kinase
MHRNLKPDNILVTNESVVKVSDFSLSRIILVPHIPYTPEDPKERERSGREARRLWYRAPEMLFRKNIYSFEVDMWSIGCLLGELSTGEPLFNGETEVEQLFKIFRFLGSPSEMEIESLGMKKDGEISIKIPNWKKVDISDVKYSYESPEFGELINSYLPARECTLQKLLEIKS